MSWVVTRLNDGEVVGEFFEQRIVDRINREKYRVEEAGAYLGRINAEIREANLAANEGPNL